MYLRVKTFFYILSTSFNNGIIQGEVVSVGFILAEKLGWNSDGNAIVNIGYIQTSGILGIAFGSLLGSKLVHKYAQKHFMKMIYIGNFMILMVNLLKQVQNFWFIFIGRFLYGVISGALNILL